MMRRRQRSATLSDLLGEDVWVDRSAPRMSLADALHFLFVPAAKLIGADEARELLLDGFKLTGRERRAVAERLKAPPGRRKKTASERAEDMCLVDAFDLLVAGVPSRRKMTRRAAAAYLHRHWHRGSGASALLRAIQRVKKDATK